MKFKIIMLTLLLLTIGFFACSESSAPKIGKDPIIEEVSLNYSTTDKSIFFSVKTDDPQGYEDVKTVTYWMYYAENDSSEEIELEPGVLFDDGMNGDITANDAIFTMKMENVDLGQYRIIAEAFDMDDNVSDAVSDTLIAQDNLPPVIYIHNAPTSFEKGDLLTLEIKATDPNGINDLKTVNMEIEQPDGVVYDYLFALNDHELNGDKVKDDGIYTIAFQTGKSNKQQGVWKFYFYGLDKSNAVSNELVHNISNPGVTVTYPDSSQSKSEIFTVGENITLQWASALVDTISLEYTTNANELNPEYIHIVDLPGYVKEYDWTIPDIESAYCKLRISDKEVTTRYDLSDEYFEVKK